MENGIERKTLQSLRETCNGLGVRMSVVDDGHNRRWHLYFSKKGMGVSTYLGAEEVEHMRKYPEEFKRAIITKYIIPLWKDTTDEPLTICIDKLKEDE